MHADGRRWDIFVYSKKELEKWRDSLKHIIALRGMNDSSAFDGAIFGFHAQQAAT